MFLRSLTIRGFKSFADRTTLEFAPGTSVIVGPNGSGKSNLVDAISWVLGEQGPRALRGAQMADVIFAGSPGRAALGTAEVSLVIDNTQELIPVEASEIEVARVVYRSGESQYLIGGEPCRLLDIQELLSDTGIGRALHTVVGQGQLEDVLVARAEDRRRYIEEAAGVAKHRRRKERAQRKLASMDQDLLRLQDVLAELKRQLRPLKQQAEAAERHERYATEAGQVAARLAAARLRSLYGERHARRPSWEEGQERRREAEARLQVLDEELAGLGARVEAAERAAAEAESDEARAAEARSRAEAELREAMEAEGEARARVAAEGGRTGRLQAMEEDARRLQAELAAAVDALGRKEPELAEAEGAFADAERRRREAERERGRIRDLAVARRAEAQTLRRSLELSAAEEERVAGALDEVRRREEAAVAERDAVQSEVQRLDAEETPHAERQARLRRDQERAAAEVAALQDEVRALEARQGALEARRAVLGQSPGRRLLARRPGRAEGLLAELIEVDRGMEKAVAAALGPLADAVVYADHAAAVDDAGAAAGATLAVAHGVPGGFVLPGERGVLSAVRADPRAEPAVVAALRHVYLAADRAEALAKHRRHRGASFVTPDGVLVGPAMVRTAPAPSEEELSVRRDDVSLRRDLSRTRGALRERTRKLEELHTEVERVNDALRRADDLITEAAERMGRLDADLAALRRERQVLEERLAVLDATVRAAREALSSSPDEPADEPDLPPAPEVPLDLRVEVESLRRERRRAAQELAARRADLQHLRSQGPGDLAAAAEEAAARRTTAEAALRDAEARARETASRREEAARALAEVREAETGANRSWREAASVLQAVRDAYEESEQFRRDVERRIEEAEGVLRRGHGVDPAEAVATLAPEDTLESLQRRSDLVARRMTLLGRVNLVAAEEYRSLQERHDFLQREIADVRAARRDLQAVVRDVDRKILEIFDAAFRDVAAEFARLFTTLFPGGEGRLSLTEPDDLLGSGIEIEARPGRKRVKRLSLLSGGERALTALAFLFAIFRARPSPFYLLDEVEAALDDVNLHRFLDLVREFATDSQVLLVTHQKRTMEAADVLYGVSMGRDGASSVIAQKVSETVPAVRTT